jgi:hypothetical protein
MDNAKCFSEGGRETKRAAVMILGRAEVRFVNIVRQADLCYDST